MTSLRPRTRRTAAVALAATGILAAPAVIVSAATVTHRTTNHGQSLPVQSRNGSSDIAPVDVNFAAYPEGSTPPPDDRGLIPAAVFKFQTAKV